MLLCLRTLASGCFLLSAGVLAVFAQPGARNIVPSSGKAMCSALAPADFSKAGVPVIALKEANLDGNDGAYCVYSSNAGKVEFDIFFPAGKNAAEISATQKTVLGEGGSRFQRIALSGAEDAQISLAMPDLPGSAGMVVRKGKAVFDIVVPRGTNAQKQLVALAQVVLGRLKQ
jgi:hypothetical protein